MLYLDDKCIREIGMNWIECINVIHTAVQIWANGEYAQPIKPYLRYNDMHNRIIAMPAYAGGTIQAAGIKWIASFPDNILQGIPRAHSVVILNDVNNGIPQVIINTPLLSVIRTVAVTGLAIRKYDQLCNKNRYNIGIIGFGPIGRHHLLMCRHLFGDKINKLMVHDIRKIENIEQLQNMEIVKSWTNIVEESDIVITCTVADSPYINCPPKKGSLHVNVSLRDYHVNMMQYFTGNIVVDDWDEVCRENTDIERMAFEKGLKKEDTISLADFICNYSSVQYHCDKAMMINPMGMALFDISMAQYYATLAKNRGIGLNI